MDDFRIKTCTVGPVGTNCYLVCRETDKKAVIVDPGDNGAYILNRCRELGIEPEAIVLTHGHFDHIMAVKDLCRSYPQMKVYAGEAEEGLLKNPSLNLTDSYGAGISVTPDVFLRDGEVVRLAGMDWHVIFTPGHTPGSACFWIQEADVLISGDTLFAESLGRTDLPGGSLKAIINSIVGKLFLLPDDTMVYPGHGEPTTIGHEKQYNPVANYRRQD